MQKRCNNALRDTLSCGQRVRKIMSCKTAIPLSLSTRSCAVVFHDKNRQGACDGMCIIHTENARTKGINRATCARAQLE